MYNQTITTPEASITQLTLVQVLDRMTTYMSGKRCVVLKTDVANRTPIRFLPRVFTGVALEIGATGEGGLAVVAFERLLTSVSSHMVIQRGFVRERGLAVAASERSLTRVFAHVVG